MMNAVFQTDSVLRVKELLAETVGGVAAGEIQFYMNDNEIPLELWSAANAIHDKELRKSFLKTALLSLKRKR